MLLQSFHTVLVGTSYYQQQVLHSPFLLSYWELSHIPITDGPYLVFIIILNRIT